MPQPPHTFTGTVKIGGVPYTGGDVQIRVKTKVGGILLPLTLDSSNVPSVVDGSYILFVQADDTGTSEREGGKPGEELQFFVVFKPGTVDEKEQEAATSVAPVLFLSAGRNGDPADPGRALDILVAQAPVTPQSWWRRPKRP